VCPLQVVHLQIFSSTLFSSSDKTSFRTYVYWTVHHLESWIKITNLMSLALLLHYLMLNMFRMLVHPSSGACELLLSYFMGCIALVRCVHSAQCSLHTDTTPTQPNHTVTPTHIVPEQYNQWNNLTNSSKLLRMDVLTSETCWALHNEIKKQVTSRWSIFIQLSSFRTFSFALYKTQNSITITTSKPSYSTF